MLIGLCGYARCGKDSVADCMKGFKKLAFATALKREVQRMLDVSSEKGGSVVDDKDKAKYRPMLVAWGQIKRAIKPDYWIRKLATTYNRICAEDIVITDVRYKNEIDWIHQMNGIVIMIARPGVGPANDEEKRSFGEILAGDKTGIDYTIVNDGSLADLKLKTKALMNKFQKDPEKYKRKDKFLFDEYELKDHRNRVRWY